MFGKDAHSETKLAPSSNKSNLVAAIIVLFVLVGYAFFVRPLASDVAAMRDVLANAQNDLDELEGQVALFDGAQKKLNLSTEVERLEILKSVPVGVNQDGVIKDLIKMVENNDIQLSSLSFGKSSSARNGVGVLRINASFQGNFNDLTDFLTDIEQNARMLQVRTINVQIGQALLEGLKRVNFSLAMDAFYQEQ